MQLPCELFSSISQVKKSLLWCATYIRVQIQDVRTKRVSVNYVFFWPTMNCAHACFRRNLHR